MLKQIKKMGEVKAKDIKIDLNKKLNEVIKQQKINKDPSKSKTTVPINTKLCPDMRQENKNKMDKLKLKL